MEKPVLGPVPKVGKGLRPTSSGGLRGGIRNRLEAAKLADRVRHFLSGFLTEFSQYTAATEH